MKTATAASRPKERAPAAAASQAANSDFWFERSQSFSAASDFARRVLKGVDDDGASGSALREAAVQLVGVVASAVATAREQLPPRLQEAYDRANQVGGLLVLHMDLSDMAAESRAALRENLSAVSGLLFGLRRSITQDR